MTILILFYPYCRVLLSEKSTLFILLRGETTPVQGVGNFFSLVNLLSVKLRATRSELRIASCHLRVACELQAGEAIKLLRARGRANDWTRVGGAGRGSSNPNYTYLFGDMSGKMERLQFSPDSLVSMFVFFN